MQLIFTFLLIFFYSFYMQAETPKTVLFFTYKVANAPQVDPEVIKSGVTGSEEALVYMSLQLAKLGYKVTVLGNPPPNSPHSLPDANPRYLDLAKDDGAKYDIAISWRMPFVGQELRKRAKQVYFWPHDTYHSPLIDSQITAYDDTLWLSQWQRNFYVAYFPAFGKFNHIFGNGINAEQFNPIHERSNPYSCIYCSNYARGLEILLEIWPQIKTEFPKATLDIYYGWQHWGLLAPEKEARMRVQIDDLENSGVHEHGLVSHEELNRALENASLWTYPCIGWETFCIAGLRAQMAGAIPVIIEGTALGETVRSGYKCKTPAEYLGNLQKAMHEADKISLEERQRARDLVIGDYTWEVIALKWKKLFESDSKAKVEKTASN